MGTPIITIKTSTIDGKGVFATKLIKSSTVILHWNPKVLTEQEAALLPEYEKRNYIYPEGDHFLWMQSPERFVNHSCDPNTTVCGRSDVAIRDIQPGEEITSDYLDFKDTKSVCYCGSALCRKPAP